MSDQANQVFERGKSYYEKGKFDEAKKEFSEAIRLMPQNAMFFLWLGLALDSQENYGEAIKAVTQAINLNPEYSTAFNNRGYYRVMFNK